MGLVTDVGSIAMVRLAFQQPTTDVAFNVLHYRLKSVTVDGGGLFAGEQAWATMPKLAQAVYEWLIPEWQTFTSNQVRCVNASAQDISPAPKSRLYTYQPPVALAGSVVNEPLPMQDAITVLKYGPGADRHNLGRVFVAGFPESANENGTLNLDSATDMGPYITALGQIVHFTLNGVTYDWWPVLYSVETGPPLVERTIEILETRLADRIFKTQRRRRPGKGI